MLVAALTAGSTLLGFLRDVVIGAVFGAGPALDAYLVAQGVMNIVLGLIAGAMARSLTPVLARQTTTCRGRAGEGRCSGHPTADVAVTVTMLVLGLASVVMAIWVAPVVSVLAPGFGPDQAELAGELTRIVLIATVLVAGTNLLAGVGHAHGAFGWAGAEGVPFNLVMIVAAAGFGPRYGVAALAVGFVVGSLARLLLQLAPLHRFGTRIRPSLDVRDPGFREVAAMLPPLLLASAVTNVNQLVDRAVASNVSEGAITALSYGWRVVNLPETVLVAAIITPLYPAIGASGDDLAELRRLLSRGLTAIVTTVVPIAVVLGVTATPVVDALFGYGAFDASAIDTAATALLWYSPGLLALGVGTLFIRACHALGQTMRPMIAAVIAMTVNVAGDLLLGPMFGVAGIAAATTASLFVAAVLNGWWLLRHRDALDATAMTGLLSRATLGATAAGLAALALLGLLPADWPSPVLAGSAGVTVALVYVAVLRVLGAPELEMVQEIATGLRRRH